MRLLNLSFVLLNAVAVLGGSFNSANVKSLNPKTFANTVLESQKASIVAFFAPWCGHCQRLAPDYERAAQNMKGLVNFAAVNCDKDSNKPLCGQYGIQGFPTIKVFMGNQRKSPRDYTGPRTAKGLSDYAADMMPSHVKTLRTAQGVQDLLASDRTKPVVVLLTTAAKVTPLYKGLSTEFKDSMVLYAVRDAAELSDVKEKLSITKVPSVLVLKPGDATPQFFKGTKISFDALKSFLEGFVKSQSKDEL